MTYVRREKFICPTCRSLIQIKGISDPGAYTLQSLYCPVCTQEWWIPGAREIWSLVPVRYGLMPSFKNVVTFTWQVEKILEKGPEPIPESYEIPQKISQEKFWEVVGPTKLDIKKVILYAFLVLAGLEAVKQVAKQVTKKVLK